MKTVKYRGGIEVSTTQYREILRMDLKDVDKGDALVVWNATAAVDKKKGRAFFRLRCSSTGFCWAQRILSGPEAEALKTAEQKAAETLMGFQESVTQVIGQEKIIIDPTDAALILECRSETGLPVMVEELKITAMK